MSKWRIARKLNVIFLDTTVKSGSPIFSPTWDIVKGVKTGRITEEEYSEEYKKLMMNSWVNNREEWLRVMQEPAPQAIACYCKVGDFCHRHLLKGYFEELCKKKEIPFNYYGELI